MVNQILISAHMCSLWSLTLWNSFWCFLHLNMLLVTEHTEVMNHFKCHSTITSWADIRLSDLASFDISVFFFVALGASEAGLFHLRDGIRSSNYNTFERNEFVNVRWIELSNLIHML